MTRQCLFFSWALRVIEILAEEKRALFQYTLRLPIL
jgi:hypothetical protein